jgi:copper ion binding protein
MSTTTLRVNGMSCDHCVKAVTEALRRLPTVSDAAVDLEAGEAVVQSSEPLDLDAVSAAIDEAGYELAR